MALYLGGKKIQDIRIGNKKISKAFIGEVQIYPETTQYEEHIILSHNVDNVSELQLMPTSDGTRYNPLRKRGTGYDLNVSSYDRFPGLVYHTDRNIVRVEMHFDLSTGDDYNSMSFSLGNNLITKRRGVYYGGSVNEMFTITDITRVYLGNQNGKVSLKNDSGAILEEGNRYRHSKVKIIAEKQDGDWHVVVSDIANGQIFLEHTFPINVDLHGFSLGYSKWWTGNTGTLNYLSLGLN